MDVTGKRVLVIGGAGFIGSHLVELLQDRGGLPHVLDNFWSGTRERVPNEVPIHDCDIRNEKRLLEIFETVQPDVVIHLAALHYIPYCNENPERTFEVNIMGTRNVLTAVKETQSISTILFASSAAIYPPKDTPHREDSPANPQDIYGMSKLIGEDLLDGFYYETGIEVGKLRLFNVFGTKETNPHLIPEIVDQLAGGSRTVELGNLTPQRDFVHVTDVAEAFLAVLRNISGELVVYNVGTGTGHSVEGVVDTFQDALNETIVIEKDPNRVRDDDPDHLLANVGKLKSETGWEATTGFREGLQTLLQERDII